MVEGLDRRIRISEGKWGSIMLKRLWERWKVIAHVIGDVQARLLLSLFYFLFLSPFALGVRLFSDPLRVKAHNRPRWISSAPETADPRQRAQRQF